MPEVFESFTRSDAASTPSTQQRAQGPLVETSASDLGELASRAQQRQRKLLDTSRKLGSNIFPAQNEPGAMPNLLGGSGQPQGIKGVANVIPNRNKVNHNDVSKRSGQIDAADLGFAPPVEKPKALEDRPLDVGYAALTPTQRNQALRSLKVDVKNFAQNPDTGEPWRTGSGATILAFDSKLSGAEDFAVERKEREDLKKSTDEQRKEEERQRKEDERAAKQERASRIRQSLNLGSAPTESEDL